MLESCIVLGVLGMEAIEDTRSHAIHLWVIYGGCIAGIICHLIYGKTSVYDMMAGMLLGVVLLAVSLLTGEQIGKGDGLILMTTGSFLGFPGNLQLFLGGLFLAGVWAFVLLAVRKKEKSTEIPFVPFLLVSYVGMLVK